MIISYLLKLSLVMVVVIAIYYVVRKIIFKKWNGRQEWFTILFLSYMVGLASLTIVPTSYVGIQESLVKGNYNIIPFKTLWKQITHLSYGSFVNLIGNVVLFIPIGFLASFVKNSLSKVKDSFYLGFSISLGIECIQLFIGRTSDVDDVILNTLAVMFGALLYRKIKKLE